MCRGLDKMDEEEASEKSWCRPCNWLCNTVADSEPIVRPLQAAVLTPPTPPAKSLKELKKSYIARVSSYSWRPIYICAVAVTQENHVPRDQQPPYATFCYIYRPSVTMRRNLPEQVQAAAATQGNVGRSGGPAPLFVSPYCLPYSNDPPAALRRLPSS